MNHTLLEKVRCMLFNARLCKQYWAEAMIYDCHLINRLPVAANDGKTPLETWSDALVANCDSFYIFGCHAYCHVQDDKLDPRAKKAKFLGFNSGDKRAQTLVHRVKEGHIQPMFHSTSLKCLCHKSIKTPMRSEKQLVILRWSLRLQF